MKIEIPIDPCDIPTAQEKGVRVVKGVPMFYKKKPLVDFENALERHLAPYYPKLRIPDGAPVYLHIAYFFPYPKSTPKRDRIDMRRMCQRPDGDNISKAVVDACGDRWAKDRRTNRFYVSRRGFFADDGAVNPLVISKFRVNENPRIVIVVRQGEELPEAQTPTKPQRNP